MGFIGQASKIASRGASARSRDLARALRRRIAAKVSVSSIWLRGEGGLSLESGEIALVQITATRRLDSARVRDRVWVLPTRLREFSAGPPTEARRRHPRSRRRRSAPVNLFNMPEGALAPPDRARAEALVGESISVELPHPPRRSLGLEGFQSEKARVGAACSAKQLLLRFEGGLRAAHHSA